MTRYGFPWHWFLLKQRAFIMATNPAVSSEAELVEFLSQAMTTSMKL